MNVTYFKIYNYKNDNNLSVTVIVNCNDDVLNVPARLYFPDSQLDVQDV